MVFVVDCAQLKHTIKSPGTSSMFPNLVNLESGLLNDVFKYH